LTKSVELREVIVPPHVLQRRLGLWSRCVENENGDWPERTLHCSDEPGDRALVRHVGREGLRQSPGLSDLRRDVLRSPVRVQAVDRHRETVSGQPHGDMTAEPAGAPGDQRDAPIRHFAGSERA
jgi:hypothetical protein